MHNAARLVALSRSICTSFLTVLELGHRAAVLPIVFSACPTGVLAIMSGMLLMASKSALPLASMLVSPQIRIARS
jgi:hypothetical protein